MEEKRVQGREGPSFLKFKVEPCVAAVESMASTVLRHLRECRGMYANELHRIWFACLATVFFIDDEDADASRFKELRVDYEASLLRDETDRHYTESRDKVLSAWLEFLRAERKPGERGVSDSVKGLFLFSLGHAILSGIRSCGKANARGADWRSLERAFVLSFWRDCVWAGLKREDDFSDEKGYAYCYSYALAHPEADPVPDLLANIVAGGNQRPEQAKIDGELDLSDILGNMFPVESDEGRAAARAAPGYAALSPATGLPISSAFIKAAESVGSSGEKERKKLSANENYLAFKLFYFDALCDLKLLYDTTKIGESLGGVLKAKPSPEEILESLYDYFQRKKGAQFRYNKDRALRNFVRDISASLSPSDEPGELLGPLPKISEAGAVEFDAMSEVRAREEEALSRLLFLLAPHGAHPYMTFQNDETLGSTRVPRIYSTTPRHIAADGIVRALGKDGGHD